MTDDLSDFSQEELLRRMGKGWDDFQAYLKTLTPEQLTHPTDAAGWTAKDHVIHLAMWEKGIDALLRKQSRIEAMGVDQATWDAHDYDRTNAVIQQQHKNMPLDSVMKTFADVHASIVAQIKTLSTANLLRPYADYEAGADDERPVFGWIVGNTYEHYNEHRPWIAAIAGKD
jgi:hypothetical protein